MSERNCIDQLGGWEGYRVLTWGRVKTDEDDAVDEVWIELVAEDEKVMRCSCCGGEAYKVHDVSERWVRELDVFGMGVWLLVWRRRVKCPSCGPKVEQLSWLEPYSRCTCRMADMVGHLCQHMTVKHVAELFGLSWHQVKQIDKRYLERVVLPVDVSGVEALTMDEFAIHKGQRYATVISNSANRQVLWLGRGRSRESVQPFFDLLGDEGCRRIQAVAMDMNAAYANEVRARCRNAEIVYDFFHVVAKYGREVIDRVRIDEAARVKDDPDARRVIKGSRWLLLRNRSNIRNEYDEIRLQELLDANRNLMTVYVLKDDLKQLWQFRDEKEAKRFWKQWYRRAMNSKIKPLASFARRLRKHLNGIWSHCRWPLNTGFLEGINNKIKVIKRMAYGFHDDEYFFLKILAAFPGNVR